MREPLATVLYIDGVEKARRSSGIQAPTAAEFRVGRQFGNWQEFFPGALAEIVVWKESRTAEQVRTYAGGSLRGNEPGLYALLRFDLPDPFRERVFGQMPDASAGRITNAEPRLPSSGPTIYQGNQIFEMNLSPELTNNLDIFNGDGAASGAMSILAAIAAPAIAAGVGATGSGPSAWLTPESAQRIGKLTFGPQGVSAGVRSAVDFHVLQRDDGRVDFVIKMHNAYHTTYSQNTNDDRMFRSLFQDQMIVRVAPQPANTSDLSICDNVCFPLTNNDKATYNDSVGWTASGGFSGSTPNAGISYSVSSSASAEYSAFTITKNTNPQTDRIEWIASMRTLCQDNGKPEQNRLYSKPDSIIVFGAFAQWLLVPPPIARSDFDQEYIAAYTSNDASLQSKSVTFDVEILQRLEHAETVGRGGIPGAKVGGTSLVVPYQIVGRIRCIANLKERSFAIQNLGVAGMNAKQLAAV